MNYIFLKLNKKMNNRRVFLICGVGLSSSTPFFVYFPLFDFSILSTCTFPTWSFPTLEFSKYIDFALYFFMEFVRIVGEKKHDIGQKTKYI